MMVRGGRFAAGGRSGFCALVTVNPGPLRVSAALTGGLSMLLAIGLPTAAGRPDVGLLASSGALSALYLASRSRHERILRLPLVQAGLVGAAAAGAAVSWHPVLAAVALVAVAAGATWLVLGLRIGPPGALFAVLVAGVSERLTAPVSTGGAGVDPSAVVGGVLLGAVVAYLVIAAPLLLPAVRARDRSVTVVPLSFTLATDGRIVLARVVCGAALAAAAGELLGLHRAYWVVLAVVGVLQSVRGRRPSAVRAVHRLVGTLIGGVVFALLALLHPAGLLLAVVIAALQFAVELIVVHHYGLALVLITPLALTIGGNMTGDIGGALLDRIVDTAVGCGLAAVVLLVDLGVDRALHAPARR
jgi:hypothetical protein